MIVGADIHVSFSTVLEKSLLKCLEAPIDSVSLQMGLDSYPRLRVSATNAVLKQKLENQSFGAALRVVNDRLLNVL
jgi:hypothetical protein